MGIEKFAFPTTIHFGAGARKLVAEHLDQARHQAAAGRHRPRHRGAAAAPAVRRRAARARRRRVFRHLRQSRAQAGDGRRRGVQGAPCRRSRSASAAARRSTSRRRSRSWRTIRATSSSTRGTIRRCADGPGDPALHRAADHRRHRLGSRTLVRHLGRRDARQEDHLLAAAAGEGRVRRSRADGRPAVADHGGHGHGRADAQRRVVPVARLSPAVRRHRARRRAHRGARAAHRGGQRPRHRRTLRHADGVDDGRDRVPEGPGRRALVRARVVDGRGHASRPRQRHHDRPRDALQPAGGDGQARRARARRARAEAATKEARKRARAPSSRGSASSRRRSAFPPSCPITARRAPCSAATSRASSKSPRPTSATRPIRASARRRTSRSSSHPPVYP